VSLVDVAVKRPVATWMIAIGAAVFGIVSYGRLALDLMPDMAYPTITVRTEAEGYAPEEVEGQVSRLMEEALSTTEGLVQLESRSRAGSADVLLEFRWGSDMDEAAQAVRERLQTTFLPEDVGRPLILRYDPSLEPIMRVALTGDRLESLRLLAERVLKRELEAMDGVAAVQVRGGLEQEISVDVKEEWLAARGVSMEQITQTLASENINLPGGLIREGEHDYLVRTLNEVRTVQEVELIEVARADGVRVPLSELATISEGFKDREVVSRLDGKDAVEIEIFKAADANVVRMAQSVRARLGGEQSVGSMPPEMEGMPGPRGPPTIADKLPDGVEMVILEDQAQFIEASLSNLRSTVLVGACLAVVVLFLFLRDFRATVIIATAIPLSIVATFAPMYLGGVSLNLMSLGGLALGVGMLVDNAVVVLESIQIYKERGFSRREAAVQGTHEVAAAVLASTLTTVSVFLPIGFVEGVAGQVFGDLSLTVVFSLLASLIVALLFVPMLAAGEGRLLDSGPESRGLRNVAASTQFASIATLRSIWPEHRGWRRWIRAPYWLVRFLTQLFMEVCGSLVVLCSAMGGRVMVWLFRHAFPYFSRFSFGLSDAFQRLYQPFAQWLDRWMEPILQRPWRVLGVVGLAVAVSIPVGGTLGRSLLPEVHQSRFTIEYALPVGTPLARTADLLRSKEDLIASVPDVAHVHSVIGTERRADSGSDEGENTAKIMVELHPAEGLTQTAEREEWVMQEIRRLFFDEMEQSKREGSSKGDQAEVRFVRPSLFSFETPIEVVLVGADLEDLRKASRTAVDALSALPGLADIKSSMLAGYPEVRVRYDRDLLRRFGLNTGSVAASVRDKVLGVEATSISRGDGRVDLLVRLEEEQRRTLKSLRRLNVNPEINPPVPLEAVATFEEAIGPSEVRRLDQRRAVVVSANLTTLDLSGEVERIGEVLDGLESTDSLEGVSWEIAGQNREMVRSLTSMQFALALAIFLVYLIMASTFESVVHPLVILFSVPLALVGVVAVLGMTQTAVSVVVFIGAIVLAGVVVNNAIVLVSTINQRRESGMDRLEAIRVAAALRLRPILITTMTTVLGLLPLALGLGDGAEVQRPLALTVIAGLASSTVLTLVVIPVVYLLATRLLEKERDAEEEQSQ